MSNFNVVAVYKISFQQSIDSLLTTNKHSKREIIDTVIWIVNSEMKISQDKLNEEHERNQQ